MSESSGPGANDDEQARLQERRLRWACRRGMLELDLVLLPYMDRRFADAPEEERHLFARLLESDDPSLMSWFSRRARPHDGELARMVDLVLEQV